MKPQHAFLSYALLGSASALTVPSEVHVALSKEKSHSPPSNKSSINWMECDLDFGEAYNAALSKLPEKPACAKLEVPLDYSNHSSGETIELQLIKYNATKKPFKGSILYNPGGPGGSSVESVALSGLDLRDIAGGHYDLIGFDTRGTGNTIPFVCNTSSPDAGSLLRRDFNTLAQADVWEYLKTTYWDMAGTFAEECYEAQRKYGRFISTPFVARDMISIADALGQGAKVNFWGVSYGTVLGQVFASMFPDRVGRLLLDANLLAEDYAVTTWVTSQRDTERALHNLLDECVNAGPQVCGLASFAGNGTTVDDLMTAVNNAIEKLMTVKNDTSGYGHPATAFKGSLMAELYSPTMFPNAIKRIHHALTGNFTAATAPAPPQLESFWNEAGSSAIFGISCGDSSFRAENQDDLYSIYQAHKEQSSFGDTVSQSRLLCSRWKFDAAESIDLNSLRNVKTSFPALIVNGRYDPVTPASTAWEVSARLRNSRTLIHYGAGHGFTSHPSSCTNAIVKDYFQDGKLPEVGTTCEPNMTAFEYYAELVRKAREGK